jgi:NAD(P)-dependent dehydrogenase (short-subunit alcohol dehydrogenase family)
MARRAADNGLRVVCRFLPPAPWPPVIVAAPRRIAPIAIEKREAAVSPNVVVGKVDVAARLARYKSALRLIAQHRDKFGAIVGLFNSAVRPR